MALAAYAAVLLIYRPVSPFEWDEILFMRAMAKYDVAAHAPHPPGSTGPNGCRCHRRELGAGDPDHGTRPLLRRRARAGEPRGDRGERGPVLGRAD